jgi:hypothetical protein
MSSDVHDIPEAIGDTVNGDPPCASLRSYWRSDKEYEGVPPACTRVAALQHLVTRNTRLEFAHHADQATDATAIR